MRRIDTIQEYRKFIKENPNNPHIQEAISKLTFHAAEEERKDYESAVAANTYEAYQSHLEKYNSRVSLVDPRSIHKKIYQYGKYESDVQSKMEIAKAEYSARLEAGRCSDDSLTDLFPDWLKKKDPNEPQRGDLMIMEGDVNLGGHRFISDEPKIKVEKRSGYWIYWSGRGVIKGPDGIKVRVGYNCK